MNGIVQGDDKKKAIPTKKKPDLTSFGVRRSTGQPNHELEEIISQGELRKVDLDLVDRDENQPRPIDEVLDGIEEFADELERDNYQLAQYPVYHIEDNGRYTIVIGERRTTGFKIKNQKKITAVCKKFSEEERKRLFILQYVENDGKLKKELSPLADANWWRIYTDRFHDGNVRNAAEARGRNLSDISNRLAILDSPKYIQDFSKHSKVRDPAVYAAMHRLSKRAGDKIVQDIIEDYLEGKIHMSIRVYLENIAKEAKGSGEHVQPPAILSNKEIDVSQEGSATEVVAIEPETSTETVSNNEENAITLAT